MKKKLPPTIYGYWYDQGTEDEYLRTEQDPAKLGIEEGTTHRVGVYKLVGHTEVRNETTIGAIIQKAK